MKPSRRIHAGPVHLLRRAMAFCVLLALAIAALDYFRPPARYEGRTVLDWLSEALQTHGTTNGGASLHALRAIGPPVVPALRRHIRACRMSDLRKFIFAVQGKLPSRFQLVSFPDGYDADTDLPDLIAIMADLGDLAKPAVAEAVLSMRGDNSHFSQGDAMVKNLGRMGPAAADAIPYLKELAGSWDAGRGTVLAALYLIDRHAMMDAVVEVEKKDPSLIKELIKPEWLGSDPELRRDILRLLEAGGLSEKSAAEWRRLLDPGGNPELAP